MLRQEWEMMGDVLCRAGELPPEERAAFIKEACAERQKLAAQASQLNNRFFAGEAADKAFDRAEVEISISFYEARRMLSLLDCSTFRL